MIELAIYDTLNRSTCKSNLPVWDNTVDTMQLARVEELTVGQGDDQVLKYYYAIIPVSFDVSKSPPPSPHTHMYRAVLACSNDGSGHLCSSFCRPHRSEHLAGCLLIQKDKNSPQTQVSDSWTNVSGCLHSTSYCFTHFTFPLSTPFPSLLLFCSPPLSFLSSLPLSNLQESH